jgi:HEAT repeat protein
MSTPAADTPEALVGSFTDSDKRIASYLALNAMGAAALPAIKAGLKHGHWQVRRWCAILLDHLADDEALQALVPLLRDPKSQVRLWAVHSISCEGCKVGGNPIDTVPLLLERIEVDESIRVRRMAVAMLGHECTAPDHRVVPVLKRVLADEEDRKLRFHAERALKRYAEAGLRW